MKAFKLIDLFGQLAVSIYLLLLYPMLADNDNGFFWWLFVLGGWQVVSALIHRFAFRYSFHNKSRTGYNLALLVTLLAGWIIFPAMLVIGPCMACWYFMTCAVECWQLSARHPAAPHKEDQPDR